VGTCLQRDIFRPSGTSVLIADSRRSNWDLFECNFAKTAIEQLIW
jgi:hypothetical protein